MNKSQIRLKMKRLRNNMNYMEVHSFSSLIIESLLNTLKNINHDSFFIYQSFNNEVNTDYLIKYLLDQNKRIFLPRINNDDMLAIPYNKDTKMKINKFGIKEPLGSPVELDEFICIIPLIATDSKGNRVGFGKGYYDKFLKDKKCLKIGLCYDFQIVDRIEPNQFDVPLDIIISEKRIIKTQCINKKKRE